MRVKIIATKQAPSLLNNIAGQVSNRPARPITIRRGEIPYWQERGWRQEGKIYCGTYKTAYGSFLGKIEHVYSGYFRLYIFDPPLQLQNHSHWVCFQKKGDNSYRIHMSRMPADVGSGILVVERILTEAFEK